MSPRFLLRGAAASAALAVALLVVPPGATAAPGPILLAVDATEAPRHILHARLQVPVSSGPLTLLYPKWIPGEHGPTGPIQNVAGLTIRAGGRPLEWRRDPVEMYAFHCDVPAGVQTLDVALDYLIPADGARGSTSATPKLAILEWNQALVYPEGTPAESLLVRASLQVPSGWKWGTALPVERSSGSKIEFRPASLVTLVDSPVLTGIYFRAISLAPEISPHHEIDIAADSPEALEASPATIAHWERLVREAQALFGAPHYREYHFLYALSDRMAYAGLEHHESSNNQSPERSLVDSDLLTRTAQLLPHEIAHSWNGKHRRPADLAVAPFLEPMRTELLWVYEGLTDYLALVLAARSGLQTLDQAKADLAMTAAAMSHESGRSWRPLRDTAESAPMAGRSGRAWGNWRRGFGDVYSEGTLLWLEADAIVRDRTGNRKSLDDFLRRFLGGEGGGPTVRPYRLEEIVSTLQAIAPYDWAAFFDQRVNRVAPEAPLGGIEGEGWRVVYTDTLDPYIKVFERARGWVYLDYSLGMRAGSDGSVIDVDPTKPAARAGIGPGMKILAVNGRKWSAQRCRDAIGGATTGRPVELLTESGDYLSTFKIAYRGGERYPKLVRDPSKPDYLTELLRPKSH
jgi:predicted metalloprotease with PDZ domain